MIAKTRINMLTFLLLSPHPLLTHQTKNTFKTLTSPKDVSSTPVTTTASHDVANTAPLPSPDPIPPPSLPPYSDPKDIWVSTTPDRSSRLVLLLYYGM